MTTRGQFILRGGAAAAGSVALGSQALGAAPTGTTSVVPTEVLLQRLIDGNKRFIAADLPASDKLAERREMLVEGQAPFASILTCADSRIIPNLVFVQGPGDLFVVRVAGNFAPDDMLGSLEYAVEHLGSRLIIVLGHEKCGAVEAVYKAIQNDQTLPPHLDAIQRGMSAAIAPVVAAKGSFDEAMRANVRHTVARIAGAGPVIKPEVERGHVRVIGAEYRLAKGEVHLLSQGA